METIVGRGVTLEVFKTSMQSIRNMEADILHQVRHFKACTTEIYLHIDARMAD